MAFEDPFFATTSSGYIRSLSFALADALVSIDTVKDWLLDHGWTLDDGTVATTTLLGIAPPVHVGGPGGFPQGGETFGRFFGVRYQIWDQYSTLGGPHGTGAEDPTGTFDSDGFPIIGVEIGTTGDETFANFAGKFNATNSDYTMDWDPQASDGFWYGTITALNPGAEWNRDDSNTPAGEFEPFSSLTFGTPPKMGGWYINSSAAPGTGDFMRLWIYESENSRVAIQFRVNGDDNQVTQSLGLAYDDFLLICNPYQFAGQRRFTTDTNLGTYDFFACCLYVPEPMRSRSITITGVTNTAGAAVVLQTSAAHNLLPGVKLPLYTFVGGPLDNSDPDDETTWYFVHDIIDATHFTVSLTMEGDAIEGGGAAYTSGGIGVLGVQHAAFVVTSFTDHLYQDSASGSGAQLVVVDNKYITYPTADTVEGYTAIMIPILSLDFDETEVRTGNQKPLVTPAYVMLAKEVDQHGFICGLLWDGFVSHVAGTLRQTSRFGPDNEGCVCWISGAVSLWMRTVEGPPL
jgi:hypothetical protein